MILADSMRRFSEKYEETLRVLLEGKLLTDVPKKDAKEIRKLAREEAFRVAPKLRGALDGYQKWLQMKRWHNGPPSMTALEKRGAKVLNMMGQICLRNFHPPWTRQKNKKVAPVIEKVVPPTTTLTQKYLAWIKDNDTVPADDVLSFFMGCVNTNWSNARAEARELGYKFERVDGGMWQVTSRPLPEVQELEDDEKDRLLHKVLMMAVMEDLSDSEAIKILRKII